MEAELNESPQNNSKTDNLVVAEEANVNEAVTEEAKAIKYMLIDLKE